jgi:hypothetical protein
MKIRPKLTRREVLRGTLGGAAITIGLPVLECMLTDSGAAFAADRQALPPIFGTWFWPLGLTPGLWEPKTVGKDYVLPEHISMLSPVKSKFNLYSGMQVFLDGKVNQNHYSGAQCQMTGMVSRNGSEYTTSIDTVIGDKIGKRARFRSIEVSCDGNRRTTWSARGDFGMNASEISVVELYKRIFGPEFRDPNSGEFTPDPAVMVRKSVLSVVGEERRTLFSRVSAADRARLDQYFTSLRDLEQQLSVELERPSPLPSCRVMPEITEESIGTLVDQTRKTHQQFMTLIAHALSCGQTQVFNVALGSSFSPLRKPGEATAYHQLSHEERIDPELGYQPTCRWLGEQQMSFFVDMIQALDAIPEGAGTLLDRALVFAYTDHGEARLHSMKNYPVFTVGAANGRMKTGYHIAATGDAATRVGLTVQHAMGIQRGDWGTETNNVAKPFSEVLV